MALAWSSRTERRRRGRWLPVARSVAGVMLAATAACGGTRAPVVTASASSSVAPAATPATPTAAPVTALATADRFVAAWQAGDITGAGTIAAAGAVTQAQAQRSSVSGVTLVDRGCVAPDQISGTTITGADVICVFARPYQGEV